MTTLLRTGGAFRRAGIALAAGASLFAMAGGALAAPLDDPEARITSVGAAWGGVVGGGTPSTVNYIPVQPQGGQNAGVRWGTGDNQSGYDFNGINTPTNWHVAESDFKLGDFTHFNYPISSGTSITQAVLTLTFGIEYRIDDALPAQGTSFQLQYRFDHNETPNADDPCADNGPHGSGVNIHGCADNVKVGLLSGQPPAFTHSLGNEYFLSITGFLLGGVVVNDFWTTETLANTAELYARFTVDPNVAPIPLPAAAWLLLGGLGALGAVARRRKSAAA